MCEGYVELLTIDDLENELETLKWVYGITKYKLTETFTKKGFVSYNVENLTIECDGDFICSSDEYDVIRNNSCVIMMFLRDSVLFITKIICGGHIYIQLLFEDGVITIESHSG